MIDTPTVFILGAGASAPYGFPTGNQIIGNILHFLEDEDDPRYLALWNCDIVNEDNIEEFQNELSRFGDTSIDTFFGGAKGEIPDIAKLATCAEIMFSENRKTLSPAIGENHWYPEIFRIMKSSNGRLLHDPHLLLNNNVTFITFNYDRSLEFFLKGAISVSFRDYLSQNDNGLKECGRIVKKMRIYHMHGKLGNLAPTKDDLVPYGIFHVNEPDEVSEFLEIGAQNIKWPQEMEHYDDPFIHVRDEIKMAERIFIIGFGYDHLNLCRLFTYRSHSRGGPCGNGKEILDLNNKQILSTEYGLRSKYKEHAINLFGFNGDQFRNETTPDFVQNLAIN